MECLLRDIRRINKHKTFEDNVTIEFTDDDLSSMTLKLNVVEGLHAGASYLFKLEFRDDQFLESTYAPRITCMSSVYHPNIVEDEKICCNLLGDEWESGTFQKKTVCLVKAPFKGTTLEGVITALYCLLDNPELDNALGDWGRDLSEGHRSDDEERRSSYGLDEYKEDLERFIEQHF